MRHRILSYFTDWLRRDPGDRYIVTNYDGAPMAGPSSREDARRRAKQMANTCDRAFVVTNERTGRGETVQPDKD